MTPRPIEEIEKAFHEMGFPPGSKEVPNSAPKQDSEAPEQQLFIRITTTTTPLAGKGDAHLE